jgi:hypothetical protein
VTERVDLDDEGDVELLDLAQLNEPVEDRLPVLVAGEVVVGDEEVGETLRVVLAHQLLDIGW